LPRFSFRFGQRSAPVHSQATLHPKGLADAKPLHGVALRKQTLSETKHDGPMQKCAAAQRPAQKFAATPEKRVGHALRPIHSRVGGAARPPGRKSQPTARALFPTTAACRQAQRSHSFTVPH